MSSEKRNIPPFRVGLLSTPSGKSNIALSRLIQAASVDQGHICIRNSDIESVDIMEIYRQFGESRRNLRNCSLDDIPSEELDRAQIRAMANVNKDYGTMGSEINRGITIGFDDGVWVDEGWNYHGGRRVSFDDMTTDDWENAQSYIDYFGREEESYIAGTLSGYFIDHNCEPDHDDIWNLLRKHKDTHHVEYSNKLKAGFKPGELVCISVGRQYGKSMLVKEYFKAEIYVAMDKKRNEVERLMRRTGVNLRLLPFEDKDIMMLLFGGYNYELLEGYGKWKQLVKKHRSR